MSEEKVTVVNLTKPASLGLLANPEEMTYEDLVTFPPETTVVSLEDYVSLKGAYDASETASRRP